MRRLALLAFLPIAAFAQASIQGLVLDPSGAAVPDASITATLDATGAARSARTGPDGRYRLPALSIGTYTIRCEKSGFQRAEVPLVYLALNQTLEQTIQLKLATAGSTIDVREQPEALNTTAPTAGTGISGEVLEETPSQNRSYLGVVLLAPGVAPAAGSNTLRTKAGVRSAAPDSGFTFAGMRARNNSLSIDGLDNRDETTGSSRVAVGQEAVAEFRVTASNVAPEFGGAAGGNLNVVTLSGSNKFHGDVNLFAADSFIE
ncbi:MAG TPA: carboxypeptidase-like regulatory domain-containing protein, partial [Candidatus Solibacter sp.]